VVTVHRDERTPENYEGIPQPIVSGRTARLDNSEGVSLLFPAAFLIIGVFLMFHPMILSGLARIQTDAGDPRYNNYMLEHSYQWILGNPAHATFWDPPIFFPAVNTAAYSENLLGSAPLYWIFRCMGILPDTAFQLWMIAATVLNFGSSFFLFKRCVGLSRVAATGGAYVFAFAGMRVSLLNAPQLLPQFFSVLAVACLFRIFQNPGLENLKPYGKPSWWIALFFLCVVLQLYAGFYLGFFLCFGLLISLIIALLFRDTRRDLVRMIKGNPAVIAVSAVGGVCALSWMAYHYLICQLVFGSPKWSEVGAMLPALKSWINMGPGNWVYGWTTQFLDLSGLPDVPEQRLGPGLVTLGIALIGFWGMRRQSWGRIAVGVFVAVLALSLVYPWGWTPWQMVSRVIPAAGAIRCVTRICLLLLIPFSLGIAYALNRFTSKSAVLILCLFMALEQAHTTGAYDKHAIRSRVHAVAAAVRPGCKAFYFVTSPPVSGKKEPWFELQLDGMWAQTLVQVPTVNGFSGHVPPDWGHLGDLMIRSRWDLLVAQVNAFKWADLNGLSPNDICVVASLRKGLEGPEPDLSLVSLDMGENQARPFLGHGWGDDEWDRDSSWVWAVGRQADLYVPLKPHAEYTLDVMAGPMDVPGKRQSMTVKVNAVQVAQLTLSDGMKSYRITVPSSMVRDYNKVEFLFGFAVSPAILGRAPDTRQLAVAFDKIQFVRATGNQSDGPKNDAVNR
jgi:hypothetical protein